MALTTPEKERLREYILTRACSEFRNGKPCVKRKRDTKMVADLHEGCELVKEMLDLVARA